MNKHGPSAPGFMPPPPYSDGGMMPPQPVEGQNIVIVQAANFGPEPQTLSCPYCHATVTTRVETRASTKTHIMAALLCLLACWPCAPCVYCTDSCLAKHHYCPSCRKYLGMCDS